MSSLTRYYPLTILILIIVTTLCLIPIEDPPLQNVRFIDKWVHMVMFGAITLVVLFEMTKNHLRHKFLLAAIFGTLYGGAIELMQAYLTTCRSGEWLDFAADAAGAIAASLATYLCIRIFFKA